VLRLQKRLPEYYYEASDEELVDRICAAKNKLNGQLMILGHHYQRDEVIRFADETGDSLALSRKAAASGAKYIVFCGVHFMAESADILTSDDQIVILPDLNAGCSMADMANLSDVQLAWNQIEQTTNAPLIPITYINSSAEIKAFVGIHGGSVCTSTNAPKILTWALEKNQSAKIIFFPDQHLGRNTAVKLGFDVKDTLVWDPKLDMGGNSKEDLLKAKFILWKGHCSVHQRFTTDQINSFRQQYPDGKVIVHPECSHEVVQIADLVGSTEFIVKSVTEAPSGSVLAVGTEIHLVNRLAKNNPDKTVICLDPILCPCATMFRIDEKHLAWVLSELIDENIVNQIKVKKDTAAYAKKALDTMLSLS
jgi:quinolinate synthase